MCTCVGWDGREGSWKGEEEQAGGMKRAMEGGEKEVERKCEKRAERKESGSEEEERSERKRRGKGI